MKIKLRGQTGLACIGTALCHLCPEVHRWMVDGGWRLVAPGDCDLELGEGRGWVCVGGEGGPVCVCLSVFVHFGTLNPSSSELASPLRHGGKSWWRQFRGKD